MAKRLSRGGLFRRPVQSEPVAESEVRVHAADDVILDIVQTDETARPPYRWRPASAWP